MTFPSAEDFLRQFEHVSKERDAFKHQMQVNLDYANCYESALEAIAKMCGWEPPDLRGSCIGGPPQDIDVIAMRKVQEVLSKLNGKEV